MDEKPVSGAGQIAASGFAQAFGIDMKAAMLTVIVDVMIDTMMSKNEMLHYAIWAVAGLVLGYIVYMIQQGIGDNENNARIKGLTVGLLTAIPQSSIPVVLGVGGFGAVLGWQAKRQRAKNPPPVAQTIEAKRVEAAPVPLPAAMPPPLPVASYTPVQTAAPREKTCPACGCNCNADFQYCPRCSSALEKKCTSCKKTVQAEWKNCAYCGASLDAAVVAKAIEPAPVPTWFSSVETTKVETPKVAEKPVAEMPSWATLNAPMPSASNPNPEDFFKQ